MDSTQTIWVCEIWCDACEQHFYEFENHHRDNCPFCDDDFDEINKGHIDKTVDFDLEINAKTGEVRVMLDE